MTQCVAQREQAMHFCGSSCQTVRSFRPRRKIRVVPAPSRNNAAPRNASIMNRRRAEGGVIGGSGAGLGAGSAMA